MDFSNNLKFRVKYGILSLLNSIKDRKLFLKKLSDE